MAKPKKFKAINASRVEKTLRKLDLVEVHVPTPDNRIDNLLWALAVAMTVVPVPAPGSTRKFNFDEDQSPEAVKLAALRELEPKTEEPTLSTLKYLSNAWNTDHPSDQIRPYVFTSSGWKVLTPVFGAKQVFLRLDNATWTAYGLRSMAPSQPSEVLPPSTPLVSPEQSQTQSTLSPKKAVSVDPVGPRRIPKVGEVILDTDQLVVLNHYESGSVQDEQISPCFHTAAEFMVTFDDGKQGPVPDKSRRAGNLVFFVERLGFAPTLVLEFHFTHASKEFLFANARDKSIQAKSRLQFSFHLITKVSHEPTENWRDRMRDCRQISDFDMFLENDGARISFKSEGAHVHDVYCYTEFDDHHRQVIPKDQLTPEQKAVLDTMAKIADLDSGETCQMEIKLIESFVDEHDKKQGKKSKLETLAELLPSKSQGRVIPLFEGRAYPQYRDSEGNLNLQFGQTPTRAHVFGSSY